MDKNVFAEALRKRERDSLAEVLKEPEDAGASDNAGGEALTEESEPVVPQGEPDMVGRAVLRAGKLLRAVFLPACRFLSIFFGPVVKPFRKGAERITRKDWLLFLGMLVTAAVAVTAPILVMRLKRIHREEAGIYTVMLGQKSRWDGGRFLIDEGNRITFTTPEGYDLEASGQPFYVEETGEMLCPFDGLWYSSETTESGRVERFSRIEYVYGEGCTIHQSDADVKGLCGFLYDNEDTYVFLEDVTVEYNGGRENLTPLSYVQVFGSNHMELYVNGAEQGKLIDLETSATATFKGGAKIDLSGDTMQYYNGVFRLLFRAIEAVKPIG